MTDGLYGLLYVNYLNYIDKVNNMQEYWVNVYQGIQPYQVHKNSSLEEAIGSARLTTYNWPIYRIHVKMGDSERRAFYPYIWKDGKAVIKPVKDWRGNKVVEVKNNLHKLNWMG